MNPSPAAASPNPNPNPAALSRAGFRRLAERNFGILAALAEDDKKRPMAKSAAPFLQRKTAAAAASIVFTSSSSVSTPRSSVSTSGRMISAVPKSKPEFALSMPGGKIYHRCAPVNVPVAPSRVRRGGGEFDMDDGDSDGDGEMLPPHEIVARQFRIGSPMTTSSVLEGVGRTLKGRDLRRVRNAILQKTGFLD
ncbi:uncharacterized protein LOC103697895 [Phoenix dactylifera]|uniref:Uncharacterized protein LOC103697895 n=1 Tax=Phoenix dactylifera TaxID=42345 RepID=A0A8B7BIZ5_PHODC|nr:uncharacterized protein LOC103697895 [Phoenix dactylifera]